MEDRATRKFQKEMNAGAISLVVLAVIDQLGRPVYGYEVAGMLAQGAGDRLPMNQAAIYPVLRSLEKQSLLASELEASDAGPPRRYYQLTNSGRQALTNWKAAWQKTSRFVNSVLEGFDDHRIA